MNPVQRLLRFISQPDHKRTFSILAFLSILAAIPLTVYIAQQSQDIRQRASGETWLIRAQPVCGNGTIPTGRGMETRIGWFFYPTSSPLPGGQLGTQYDRYAQGSHDKTFTNNEINPNGSLYMFMEPEDEVEWEGFQPIEPNPNTTFITFARGFTPEIWYAQIHPVANRPLDSGDYTIKFKAPERWCNPNATPTPTPTRVPNALPQGLTVKPLIACSDTPISDGRDVVKFIYFKERSVSLPPSHIAIATKDAGSPGSQARGWEYFTWLESGYPTRPDCNKSCTINNEDPQEDLRGNRCCLLQPNQFNKVKLTGDYLTQDPNDKLVLQPDTIYYARLVMHGSQSTQPSSSSDVRTTFSIPSCRSLTPTPTPTPTLTPISTPTPTGAQTPALFTFTFALTGISQDGNGNPRTPQRPIQIELFDSNNEPLPIKTGTVTFNNTTNRFGFESETVNMGTLPEGNYTIKVKTPKYLKKRVPGIQTIVNGRTAPYIIPSVTLVVGDANNDNKLDIIDYNLILSCFGDRSCNNKDSVDFNDDGQVDGVDYNLFVRSVGTRQGD